MAQHETREPVLKCMGPGHALSGMTGAGMTLVDAARDAHTGQPLCAPTGVIHIERKIATTPAGFKARVAADVAKWTKVVADAGIKRLGGGQ